METCIIERKADRARLYIYSDNVDQNTRNICYHLETAYNFWQSSQITSIHQLARKWSLILFRVIMDDIMKETKPKIKKLAFGHRNMELIKSPKVSVYKGSERWKKWHRDNINIISPNTKLIVYKTIFKLGVRVVSWRKL